MLNDNDFKELRLKVLSKLSSSYNANDERDKIYLAIINLSSKVVIDILKEYQLLNS